MNRNTNRKSTRRILGTISAVAAASALSAALVFPAVAEEPAGTQLTFNETGSENPSFMLTDVSDVVKAALPSVVSITSRTMYNYINDSRGYSADMNDIWKYFFGDSSGFPGFYQETPEVRQPEAAEDAEEEISEDIESEEDTEEDPHANERDYGIGSGTIIAKNDKELLILTSYHVVEGCSSLYVTFNNDTDIDGYIKSVDEDKDIAVVAVALEDIDEETLDSISIAPISKETPEVGDGIIIIGNALGYGISVTTGIVSAVDREITVDGKTLTVIQTDAAINQGNSGGCMLNSKGEIVGISEAKVTISYVEGMCYAIPVVSNLDTIQELVNAEGNFEDNKNINNGGFLGIQGKTVTEDASTFDMPLGVYVVDAIEGGGAKDAGIKKGDIITAVDGKEVSTMEELSALIVKHYAGDTITVTIARTTDGEYVSQDIEVTLTERIS